MALSLYTVSRRSIRAEIRPYISNRTPRNSNLGSDASVERGADIFYNITPSLKWTTSINTDFAETEVDTRRINLTRFPLFFPEKRAFFLENAGAFDFLNTSEDAEDADIIPFFSRAIGLLDGEETPILAGTKLTGKAGDYGIGLLAVRTRATNLVTAKDFAVARVKRHILKQSYVGGIFTSGDPASPAISRTFGGDFRLFSSRFLGKDQNFGVDGFLLETSHDGLKGKTHSFGVAARYPNDLWDLSIDWKQIEKNFTPTLGFVPRTDVRKLEIAGEFDPRPRDFLNIRQMFHEVSFTRFTNLSRNQVESWRVFTAPINYELNSGEEIEFNYAPQFERLFEPFEIAKSVTLPPGEYRFTRWRALINTASKRRWQLRNAWWFGSFWSGHANQFETTFQYKMAPHVQTGITLDQTYARLAEGKFVTRVVVLRADYSVSPLLTFFNVVQFDDETTKLGWQSRIRWTLRPGNDIFLVLTRGWLQDEARGRSFHSAETKLAVKMQYTFRF